jgi:hypothetical protein
LELVWGADAAYRLEYRLDIFSATTACSQLLLPPPLFLSCSVALTMGKRKLGALEKVDADL